MIRVIIAGEGRNELGSFASEEVYRRTLGRKADRAGGRHEAGVLEALLRHVEPNGWEVVDAILWKNIPKLQVGIGRKGEAFNVLRAFHHAKKKGCDVLVFARDRDGSKNEERQRDIEGALKELDGESQPRIVGGIAIEKLEAWLVAIAGMSGSESIRHPENELAGFGVGPKDTTAMVDFVVERGLARVAKDAASLNRWLERARVVFASLDPG